MKNTDKNIIIFIIITLVAVVMWIFMQYSSSQEKATELELAQQLQDVNETEQQNELDDLLELQKSIPAISATDLNNKMDTEEMTIIDMRSQDLYNKGHIRGSLSNDGLDPAQIQRTVVLVTGNGSEDLITAQYRELSSTKKVYNLTGGIAAWSNEGYALLSIENTPSFEASSKVQFVEPRDLDAAMNDPTQNVDLTIIDTRRPGNFEKGHISGALNIPLADVEFRFKEIPRSKKIYIYGADQDTSFQSGILFHDLRFIGAKTIKGGFAAWEEYGYPIVQ